MNTFNTLDWLVYTGTYETIFNTCMFKARNGNCYLPIKKEYINERYNKHHAAQEAKHHISTEKLLEAYRLVFDDILQRKQESGVYSKYELTDDAIIAIKQYEEYLAFKNHMEHKKKEEEENSRAHQEWLDAQEARERFFNRFNK